MSKPTKKYTIGIDIGGTKMSAVLFDGERVIADDVLGTPKDNVNHMLVMLKALVEPLQEKAKELKVKVSGVGLGVAGVIDYREARMLKSPNIPMIDGIKLAERLEKAIGLPVAMDNDANCFVRAEAVYGGGRGFNNVYGIIIGTGIGGGWWVNGDIYKGAQGGAGEPGEIIIDFETEMGLEEAYHKLTQNNPANLAEEAYRGDVLAQKTYEEVGKLLGIGFASIANIVDPEVFVIGGGVVESSDLFLASAKKYMKTHIESSVSQKKIKILKGKIGANAGAIGAALLIK